MATNPYVNNLMSAGWRYDANRGGYIRGDTRWNARTQSFDSSNNVGGDVFIPSQSARTAGVSSVVQSPALPAFQAPAAYSPASVGVSSMVRSNPVRATMANWQAPDWNAEKFGNANVRARDVDPFMIEDTAILRELDQQAQGDLALGRSLSPEQVRAATQQARAAFAARGMATGVPAVAAEILNRDEYASAREASRRQFAAGVSGMMTDIDRANQVAYNEVEMGNANRDLQAAGMNQGAGLERWRTEAQGGLQVSLQNASESTRVAIQNEANRLQAAGMNQEAALRAAIANQSAGLQAAQLNQGTAVDYARLGLEGSLGAFNAGTNRMNAMTNAQQAAGGGGTYAGIPQNVLADRYMGSQYQAGVSAAGRTSAPTYRPLGTTSWYGGYRNI